MAKAKAKAPAEKPPVKDKSPVIEIVSASYGTETTMIDVTEKVKELQGKQFEGCEVYDDQFSDPALYKIKKLKVVYTVNGEEKSKDFAQNTPISLE